jgi:hypothetical protein
VAPGVYALFDLKSSGMSNLGDFPKEMLDAEWYSAAELGPVLA